METYHIRLRASKAGSIGTKYCEVRDYTIKAIDLKNNNMAKVMTKTTVGGDKTGPDVNGGPGLGYQPDQVVAAKKIGVQLPGQNKKERVAKLQKDILTKARPDNMGSKSLKKAIASQK